MFSKKDSGFILVNKPVGPTSHDIVNKLRRITLIKKIGHAGTLDPFAGGLLILAIGREATKKISQFVKLDKEYEAEIKFGASTDTYDLTGKILKKYSGEPIKLKNVEEAVGEFIGKQKQIPPMFSAKKIKGKKLYELARAGREIAREPAEIEIFSIKIKKYRWPNLRLIVRCGSGTYIRSLANDLGDKLACGAFLSSLKRTKIGVFSLKKAYLTDKISPENWRKKLIQRFVN